MAVKMLIVVPWFVMPCTIAGGYQCPFETLEITYRTTQLHSPEDHNGHVLIHLSVTGNNASLLSVSTPYLS
jgi:hypothetical protein